MDRPAGTNPPGIAGERIAPLAAIQQVVAAAAPDIVRMARSGPRFVAVATVERNAQGSAQALLLRERHGEG
jgi:hypothetical protein